MSLYCKQINKVKNELDGQPSNLLVCMHVSNYKTTFFPMHLVFLELDTHRPHLDFKILVEKNNKVIPRTFYLQLLNKESAYTTTKQKAKFTRFKPYSITRTTNILLKKLTEIEVYLFDEIEIRERIVKKRNDPILSQAS